MKTLIDSMDQAIFSLLGGDVSVVTYTSGYGEMVNLSGKCIFDRNHAFSDLGQAGVSDFSPALFAKEDDFGPLVETVSVDTDAIVIIDDYRFTVFEPRIDGSGGVILRLLREEPDSGTP